MITGAADTSFILKKDSRAENTAALIATGRDIGYQQLVLQFTDFVRQLIERKDGEELRKDEIPEFVFRIVGFVKEKKRWSGTATELLAAMEEDKENNGMTAARGYMRITSSENYPTSGIHAWHPAMKQSRGISLLLPKKAKQGFMR